MPRVSLVEPLLIYVMILLGWGRGALEEKFQLIIRKLRVSSGDQLLSGHH